MKKVISISYYADFSRYFMALHETLGKDKVEWLNLCIHPSAFSYSIVHKLKAKFIPYESTRYIRKKKIYLSESEIQEVCSYYDEIDDELSRRTNYYYCYLKSILEENTPDIIILSGDDKMPVKILKKLSIEMNITVIHFEQGPFNTTILDPLGVNANCSFRYLTAESEDDNKKNEIVSRKPLKWKGYKKYRILDILSENMFPNLYPELIKKKIDFSLSKHNKIENIDCNNYILLVLQVPEDVNMVSHSPFFNNHYEIVKSVSEALPDNYSLVVREHPLYINKYEKSLYDLVSMSKNIYFKSSDRLNESIVNSELVIVNNSTVGVEAMLYNKQVIVLGNSYYDHDKYIYKYKGKDLSRLILKAINSPLDEHLIQERLNYLFNNHFIRGHFRDLDLNLISEHAEVINDAFK